MLSSLENINFAQLDPLSGLSWQGSFIADSRKIKKGDVFLAFPGEFVDGRNFIPDAINKGAVAIIYEDSEDFSLPNYSIPVYGVKHLRSLAGIITAKKLNNLNSSNKMIGVTGTNGKTSITQWLAQAFSQLNQPTAIIGTVGNGFLNHLDETTYTTPDAVTLQYLIHKYKTQGAKIFCIEVSSHGLDQARVNGVPFDTAIFTNLTRDHLDYHHSMANYFAAKKKLFYWQGLRHAVINLDDAYGRELIRLLKRDCPELIITSYGFSAEADICIKKCILNANGMQLSINHNEVEFSIDSSLFGHFNALNLVATYGVLNGLGYTSSELVPILANIKPAKGRMEALHYQDKPLIIIDYAHTPDALQNTLEALQPLTTKDGKIWCVFGCGGNRDHGKRPLMGKVANQYADISIVTSDNPRNEDPMAIIKDILPVENAQLIEPNRQVAIEYAIVHAKPQDIVLIAGKGHESYQEVQGIRHHFDDLETAKQVLEII